MNAIFITQVWPLEGQRNMYSDLIDALVNNGVNVCAVVLNEKRNKKKNGLTVEDNRFVLRVKCGNIQKTNKYIKVISSIFAGPSLYNSVKRALPFIRLDVIIWALSTTIISPWVLKLKRCFHCNLYLLLKEYWPQDPLDLGAMKKNGLIFRLLSAIEKKMILGSDYIGTCSPAGIDYVLSRYSISKNRLRVIPNCEKNEPLHRQRTKLLQYGIPDNQVVFLFGGNMGVSQGIDDMISCIETASSISTAFFLLLGSGTEFEKVKTRFINSKRVQVMDSIPQKDFYQLCCEVDVGMLFLYKGYTVPNVPGKFTTYLNAGLPIIAAVDEATDVGTICETNKCGFSLINGDVDSFVLAVKRMLCPEIRKKMSQAAKKLFINEYDANVCATNIINHMNM